MSKLFVFGLIIIISCYALSTYQHEQVHVLNNTAVGYGSEIKLNMDQNNFAIGTYKTGEFKRDLTNYELAQNYNEAINYNLTPLLMGIMLIIFLGFIDISTKLGELK